MLLGAGAGLLCVAWLATAAGATTASATITAGPLGMATTPPRLTATTVVGGRTEATGTQQLDVIDATGSGARWAITLAPAQGSMPSVIAAALAAGASCRARSSSGPVTFATVCSSVAHPSAAAQRAIAVLAIDSECEGDEHVVLTWRLTSGTALDTRNTSRWVLSLVTGP